ncbi:MAG: hypothetical protein PVF76_11505 [Syntrophobacterales bacterium]|jgi:hypothetical protein
MRRKELWEPLMIAAIALLALCLAAPAVQAAQKPNILVIMSDDVGITNTAEKPVVMCN